MPQGELELLYKHPNYVNTLQKIR